MVLPRDAFDAALSRCPNPRAREHVLKLCKIEGGTVEITQEDHKLMVAICQHEGFGLGDAVAWLASPAAKAIDSIIGTDLSNCGGCARRRAALNSLTERLTTSQK